MRLASVLLVACRVSAPLVVPAAYYLDEIMEAQREHLEHLPAECLAANTEETQEAPPGCMRDEWRAQMSDWHHPACLVAFDRLGLRRVPSTHRLQLPTRPVGLQGCAALEFDSHSAPAGADAARAPHR